MPMSLPQGMQMYFQKFALGEMPYKAFDQWLCSHAAQLEEHMADEAYLNLISTNFNVFEERLSARRLVASVLQEKEMTSWIKELEKKVSQTLKQIEQVFHGVSREGGISLSQAGVLDKGGAHNEFVSVALFDVDKCWQDVPDSEIVHHAEALLFLDEIGIRYYLPAYMVFALKNSGVEKGATNMDFSWSIHMILVTLSSPCQERNERFQLFSLQQKEVVCQFLALMMIHPIGIGADYHEAAYTAMTTYWKRFYKESEGFKLST
ncbi:DUF6714 family protein [Saezia sanguinis]|uniref:DUF6714 family protein n=1 Tax=Saezia sanguinis TaxID=1965230 RepID=UPI0030296C7E